MNKIITTIINQFTKVFGAEVESINLDGTTATVNGITIEVPAEYNRYTTWRAVKAELEAVYETREERSKHYTMTAGMYLEGQHERHADDTLAWVLEGWSNDPSVNWNPSESTKSEIKLFLTDAYADNDYQQGRAMDIVEWIERAFEFELENDLEEFLG